MKILHLIAQRPDSTGSGIYLQQLMARAHLGGHTNNLICALSGKEAASVEGVSGDKISAVRFSTPDNPEAIVGMSDVMPYPSRIFRNLSTSELDRYVSHFRRAITTSIRSWGPDLIHSHHLWLVSSLAAEIADSIPIVCSCHGSDLRQFHQCPHLRDQVIAGCTKQERILALSNDQKTRIERTYGIESGRIQVVGAGYDEKLFTNPGQPIYSTTPPAIVYAGKLSRAKGVIWLLKALQSIELPFHLHLVGSGQGEEAQQCHAEALSLGDRVTIHGSLSQPDLAGLLQKSDFFVLPSLFEGLPLVILEALASGCRVIATDLPGCWEIKKRTGAEQLLLITTPNVINSHTTELDSEERFVSDLRQALTSLLELPQPSDTSADLSYFSWSAVYQRIEKNWDEVLSEARRK